MPKLQLTTDRDIPVVALRSFDPTRPLGTIARIGTIFNKFVDHFVNKLEHLPNTTREEAVLYGKYFLNSYCKPEGSSGTLILAAMTGLLSYAKVGEDKLLSKHLFSDDAVVIPTVPATTVLGDADLVVSKVSVTSAAPVTTVIINQPTQVGATQFVWGNQELRDCYLSFWTVLDRVVDATKDSEIAELDDCLGWLAFLSMNMLRMITNPDMSIVNHIFSSVAITCAKFWPKFTIATACGIPHSGFYKLLRASLQRFSSTTNRFLTYLIYTASMDNDVSANCAGAIKAGCLLSLSMTGLPLLYWMIKAEAEMGRIDGAELLHKVWFKSVEKSLQYGEEGNPQQTWPWARLLEENTLTQYSVGPNNLLISMFVGIVSGGDSGDDIWKADSLKTLTQANIAVGCHVAQLLTQHKVVSILKGAKGKNKDMFLNAAMVVTPLSIPTGPRIPATTAIAQPVVQHQAASSSATQTGTGAGMQDHLGDLASSFSFMLHLWVTPTV